MRKQQATDTAKCGADISSETCSTAVGSEDDVASHVKDDNDRMSRMRESIPSWQAASPSAHSATVVSVLADADDETVDPAQKCEICSTQEEDREESESSAEHDDDAEDTLTESTFSVITDDDEVKFDRRYYRDSIRAMLSVITIEILPLYTEFERDVLDTTEAMLTRLKGGSVRLPLTRAHLADAISGIIAKRAEVAAQLRDAEVDPEISLADKYKDIFLMSEHFRVERLRALRKQLLREAQTFLGAEIERHRKDALSSCEAMRRIISGLHGDVDFFGSRELGSRMDKMSLANIVIEKYRERAEKLFMETYTDAPLSSELKRRKFMLFPRNNELGDRERSRWRCSNKDTTCNHVTILAVTKAVQQTELAATFANFRFKLHACIEHYTKDFVKATRVGVQQLYWFSRESRSFNPHAIAALSQALERQSNAAAMEETDGLRRIKALLGKKRTTLPDAAYEANAKKLKVEADAENTTVEPTAEDQHRARLGSPPIDIVYPL